MDAVGILVDNLSDDEIEMWMDDMEFDSDDFSSDDDLDFLIRRRNANQVNAKKQLEDFDADDPLRFFANGGYAKVLPKNEEPTELIPGANLLPEEIINYIFSFWTGYRCAKTASRVCVEWHALLNTDEQWLLRIKKEFNTFEIEKQCPHLFDKSRVDYNPDFQNFRSIYSLLWMNRNVLRRCTMCFSPKQNYDTYHNQFERLGVPRMVCSQCQGLSGGKCIGPSILVTRNDVKQQFCLTDAEIRELIPYRLLFHSTGAAIFDTREAANLLKVKCAEGELEIRRKKREQRFKKAFYKQLNEDRKLRADLITKIEKGLKKKGLDPNRAEHLIDQLEIKKPKKKDYDIAIKQLAAQAVQRETAREELINYYMDLAKEKHVKINRAQAGKVVDEQGSCKYYMSMPVMNTFAKESAQQSLKNYINFEQMEKEARQAEEEYEEMPKLLTEFKEVVSKLEEVSNGKYKIFKDLPRGTRQILLNSADKKLTIEQVLEMASREERLAERVNRVGYNYQFLLPDFVLEWIGGSLKLTFYQVLTRLVKEYFTIQTNSSLFEICVNRLTLAEKIKLGMDTLKRRIQEDKIKGNEEDLENLEQLFLIAEKCASLTPDASSGAIPFSMTMTCRSLINGLFHSIINNTVTHDICRRIFLADYVKNSNYSEQIDETSDEEAESTPPKKRSSRKRKIEETEEEIEEEDHEVKENTARKRRKKDKAVEESEEKELRPRRTTRTRK